MVRLGRRSETWRYTLLGGLIALPGTALLYWQSADTVTYGPILLGGLVAGYVYDGEKATRRRIGARTGLIGGLPALWPLADMFGALPALAGPAWFRVAGTGLGVGTALVVSLVALGLAAVTGVVGAAVGDWLSRKTGRRGSPAAATR
jgi:hypothetical protein